MTNSIWDELQEREKMYFGHLELQQTHLVKGKLEYNPDHHDKDNPKRPEWAVDQWPDGLKPFWFIEMSIGPLTGGDLRPNGMYEFDPGWKKHTRPSVVALVKSGKLTSADDINLKWVQYTYKPWRDYKTNTVEFYQSGENADKVHADERGNFFVEKKALFIVDVFSTEDECILARDKWYDIEAPENGNGGSPQDNQSASVPAGNGNVALSFLPHFVKQALGDDHKVDRSKLAADIANNAVFAGLTVDSPEVAAEIEKVEAEAPF